MGPQHLQQHQHRHLHQALELTAQPTSEQKSTSLPSHAHPDRELRRPWSDRRRRARRHHPRPPLRKPQPQAKGSLLSCVPNSTTLSAPYGRQTLISPAPHHFTHSTLHHFISLHPLHHSTPLHFTSLHSTPLHHFTPPTSPLHHSTPLHFTTLTTSPHA